MNFFYSFLAALLIISSVAFVDVNAFQEPDLDALTEFCSKESNRKFCQRIAELASESAHGPQMRMDKRKPSFVRFGKRSASPYNYEEQEEAGIEMEKRKPSFVRFGRK